MAASSAEAEGDRNAALVKKYIASIEAEDKAALMQLVTEDSVFEMPFNVGGVVEEGHFTRLKGLKDVDAYFAAMKANFDRVRVAMIDMSKANEGRTIFLECKSDIQMRNGRIYRNRYVMRFDFEDGKIIRFREYYNPIPVAYAFERLLAGRYKLDSFDYPVAG
jgi:ketosteroid isomerase-like protein